MSRHGDQLAHLIRLRQLQQLYVVFIHLFHSSRQQRKAYARLHQANHRKDIVNPGDNFRLESGHLKSVLKSGIGGKPFRQRNKLAPGVIAQLGGSRGIQLFRRRGGEKDIILKQRDHIKSRIIEFTFVGGDQDRIERVIFQHIQQHLIGAHGEIQLQFRPTQLHAHNNARHGFKGQGVKRADAQPALPDTGYFTRRFQPAGHQAHDVLTVLQQRPRSRERQQVAPFMNKQRAADALFQRMQRPVDADAAQLHGLSGSGDVPFRHKHHKYRQLAEGDVLINVVFHCPGLRFRSSLAFSFVISRQYNHN